MVGVFGVLWERRDYLAQPVFFLSEKQRNSWVDGEQGECLESARSTWAAVGSRRTPNTAERKELVIPIMLGYRNRRIVS
jgi:hypothetical protein